MSSTERAPEPTMEEILASIRRIISDEEASAPNEAAPATAGDDYPVRTASADADYEVADTQIIDDIARVLSGGAPADDPLEMSEDDILDLDLGDALEAEPAEELVVIEETVVLNPTSLSRSKLTLPTSRANPISPRPSQPPPTPAPTWRRLT